METPKLKSRSRGAIAKMAEAGAIVHFPTHGFYCRGKAEESQQTAKLRDGLLQLLIGNFAVAKRDRVA